MIIRNTMICVATSLLVAVFVSGCSTYGDRATPRSVPVSEANLPDAPKADPAAKAIADAKAAMKKAKAVGGLWRYTGKILKSAEKRAKAGNKAKAVKLANKARRHAELGEKQAKSEAKRVKALMAKGDKMFD